MENAYEMEDMGGSERDWVVMGEFYGCLGCKRFFFLSL